MNWMKKNRHYSNPIFGLLFILNVMVLPSYQAAAIGEPIQTLAQTAEQISDAIDAVEVGITPEESFLGQPGMYRTWGSSQKKVYEDLFDRNYDSEDAVYILDSEVSSVDEFSTTPGSNVLGDEFFMHHSLLIEYDYSHNEDLNLEVIDMLSDINARILLTVGTISSEHASVPVAFMIFQADRDGGGRNRSMLLLSIVQQETIDNLLLAYQWSMIPELLTDPVGEPQNCEDAFSKADRKYKTAIDLAKSDLLTCKGSINGIMTGGMIGCLGAAVAGGAMASPTGPGALVGAIFGYLGCMTSIAGAAVAELMNCHNEFNGDMRNAQIIRDAARAEARAIFGEENCPGDPV